MKCLVVALNGFSMLFASVKGSTTDSKKVSEKFVRRSRLSIINRTDRQEIDSILYHCFSGSRMRGVLGLVRPFLQRIEYIKDVEDIAALCQVDSDFLLCFVGKSLFDNIVDNVSSNALGSTRHIISIGN